MPGTDAPVKPPLSGTEFAGNGPLILGEGALIAPERECLPWIAPEGDRYLCYARVNGEPQLWLATIGGGLERVLVRGAVHFDWAQDDEHILYSPWASPPTAPDPQPVYLLDLETGETLELGRTIRGNLMQAVSNGWVAFLTQEGVELVDPENGTRMMAPVTFEPANSPPVVYVSPESEETAVARFGFLLTPEALEVNTTPPLPDAPDSWAADPNVKVYFEVSPDGKKVALLQVVATYATIGIVDVDTGRMTYISDLASYWAVHPLAWSPEGDRLLFALATVEGHAPELWMVDAEGANPTLVLDGGEALGIYDDLLWLPGDDVLFALRGSSMYDTTYYASNAGGATPVELVGGVQGLQVARVDKRVAWTKCDPRAPESARTFLAALVR